MIEPVTQTEFVVYWGGQTPDDAEGRFVFDTISEADKLLAVMPAAQLAWRTWTATPWTRQADIPPLTAEQVADCKAEAAQRVALLITDLADEVAPAQPLGIVHTECEEAA